jgi:Holliday junction resolvase RusA-like endonuclease
MNRPTIILKLSVPPTVNNLFLTAGRRRVKSKRYRAWQKTAGWELLTQRHGCIGGPWTADIVLPTNLKGDTDNYSKALLDLLVSHGVVDDDRFCRKVTIGKTGNTSEVIITLVPAGHMT